MMDWLGGPSKCTLASYAIRIKKLRSESWFTSFRKFGFLENSHQPTENRTHSHDIYAHLLNELFSLDYPKCQTDYYSADLTFTCQLFHLIKESNSQSYLTTVPLSKNATFAILYIAKNKQISSTVSTPRTNADPK